MPSEPQTELELELELDIEGRRLKRPPQLGLFIVRIKAYKLVFLYNQAGIEVRALRAWFLFQFPFPFNCFANLPAACNHLPIILLPIIAVFLLQYGSTLQIQMYLRRVNETPIN